MATRAKKKPVTRRNIPRKMCEKGKFKDLLEAITTEELRQGFKPDLTQPIHYFAARGKLEAVRELVETYKCNPECQNVHGITPLHCASYCGRLSVVKYLANKHKCDVNVRDEEGACPLAYASYCVMSIRVKCPLYVFKKRNKPRNEHIQTAKFLVSLSTLQTASLTKGLCILRLPLHCGSFDDFKLLESILNLAIGDSSLELCCEVAKCLDIALSSEESKLEFVTSLLRTYAEYITIAMNVSESSTKLSVEKSNVFHLACSKADIDVVKMFLKLDICKPDVQSLKKAIDRKHYELVEVLLHSADHPLLLGWFSESLFTRTSTCMLSYIFSRLKDDKKLIRLVVDATIGTDVRDAKGNTPLHLLCKHLVTERSAIPFIPEEYSCYQSAINSIGELPLHNACKNGDIKLIKIASSQLGEDKLNAQDNYGDTPLHIACKFLTISTTHKYWECYSTDYIMECLKYFMHEKMCDCNIQNNLGELPLHTFLKRNDYHVIKGRECEREEVFKLITSDRINAQDSEGNTPLHLACKRGDSQCVLYLVSNCKCDLSITNDEECLPLHYALSYNLSLEAVRAVSNGCTVKCKQNNLGKTPLHIACEKKLNNCWYFNDDKKKLAVELSCDEVSINVQDNDGNTPLHISCQNGDIETVIYLTSRFQCDLDVHNNDHCLLPHSMDNSNLSLKVVEKAGSSCCTLKNNVGKTPLHLACENMKYKPEDMKSILLHSICDKEVVNVQDNEGNTPLHIACRERDLETATYLTSKFQCDLNMANDEGCLPLHYALSSKLSLEAVEAVSNGCTVKCKQNNIGKTPLHIACEEMLGSYEYYNNDKNDIKTVLELICDENSINVQDNNGNTPLHIACLKGKVETAIYLTSKFDCDFDLRNSDNCLPIHCALKSYHRSLDLLKIVSGCTLMHIQNNAGMTPLHIACENEDIDAVKYLVFCKKCFPNKFKGTSDIYDNLNIHLACKDESDINLLKCLANEQNVHKSERYYYENVTPLHVACDNCNHLAVKLLLELSSDVMFKDSEGSLPFHVACSKSLECVKEMSPYTTNKVVNTCDLYGDTPLHKAFHMNCLDIVEFLLSTFQCDFTIESSVEELPLHTACKTSLSIVKVVMEMSTTQSISVNCQTRYGNTPLHITCQFGALDIVKYLTESFDCKPSMRLRNKEGKLPVDYACEHSLEIVKLVCQSCTVKELLSHEGHKESTTLTTYSAYRHETPTTLDIACQSGSLNIVKYLIKEKGFSLSALSNNHSALWYASAGQLSDSYRNNDTRAWPEIVKFLIDECGYNPEMIFHGTSLIHHPYRINNLPLLKVLPVHIKDRDGNTPLHYSCKYNCTDIVKYLVDCGCDQNITNNLGESPLHIASYSSLEVTKLLTNCDVNMRNAQHQTSLHIACEYNKKDIVRYLVEESNCDVKTKSKEGEYPLHIATLNSLQIESLVQRSDINCQDDYGDTPLHNACFLRDTDMIQFLLSFQQCRADILNEDGDLALHVFLDENISALYRFSYENELAYSSKRSVIHDRQSMSSIKTLTQIVELILKRYPAAAITTNHDGFTPIDMAITSHEMKLLEVLLNIGEVDDVTSKILLHNACKHGQPEIVDWLIVARGASTEVTDDDGDYPQHICFKHDYSCLRILKQLGPVDVCKQDKNNDTVLHFACRRRSEDVLQYILERLEKCKEAFSMQNTNKDTPLHLLASSRIQSAETLALIECVNPNLQDKSGNTPLHLACQHEYFELAEHLLTNCKCDPSVVNVNGELPLHIAVSKSQLKIIKLLANSESVNKCTKHGDSPLHIECQEHTLNYPGGSVIQLRKTSLEIVKLVGTPDNANMQNSNGDTPLHIACCGSNLDIVFYLLKELKCSIHLLNENSESAFHILFKNWHYHRCSTELKHSLLPYIPQHLNNVANKTGDTLLHIACGQPDYETVKYLIEKLGCMIDALNQLSGATALHYACTCNTGIESIVKLLSECNPKSQIKDVSYLPKEREFVSGDTPLHVACRKGNINVIRHLLESGHSQALNCPNILKELPIHLAVAANQSLTLIQLFIQYKECFDHTVTNVNGDTLLHIMCKHVPSGYAIKLIVHKLRCKVDVQNKEDNLPLHIACQNEHISKGVIKVLCEALSNNEIKQRNKNGNTALHEFLRCQRHKCNKIIIQSILQIFIDRGLFLHQTGDGQALDYIHLACRYQKVGIVKYFCKKYVSLSQEIPMTVLYEACHNCNNHVLQYILGTFDHAFDVNVPNENGDLPLHLAARMNICMESTILLVEKTKNVNYKNNQGETPLHMLYGGGKTSIMSHIFDTKHQVEGHVQTLPHANHSTGKGFNTLHVLLKFLDGTDVDLEAMSNEGCTPLHCMCRADKFDDLKHILEHEEINTNLQDKNGATLLHLACQANNFDVVELILTFSEADPSIEDNKKQAPITLTTDPRIIKLLIECGADPQPLCAIHKEFFERFSCEKPPPTPAKLLVIGYPSVGKTTLIRSLQNELSEEVISEHFNHTAGIVTTNFSSQHYGVVTFYDFAGQAEYYASHDAVLHMTIKNVPPIVLILVNLNGTTKSILNQTNYWINFMANRCSGLGSEAAHMILVGSHADVLESCGRNPLEKVSKLHQLVAAQVEKKNIILKGIVHLNCTKSKSSEMSRLQELLQQSTSDLREKGVMDFNSHCFYVFLLHMFRNNNVVHLGRILSALKSKSKDEKDSPLFALPSDRPEVIKMCHDLNEKGHIMFIEHPTIIDMSWLILDKAPLLHEILGTLFSPTDFPQHCPLSYSTGVVPLSRFDKHFSNKHSYPSNLSLSFLSRMEYCREIKDRVVLESIVNEEDISEYERYYFFPNLVSLERPTDKWSRGKDSKFTYNSGWFIQCKAEGECFNPHFIQALLLRLAFSFTPKKEADGVNDIEFFYDNSESEEEQADESQIKEVVMKRLCSVWKNGIYWMEASGVKTVVEVIDQNTLVMLMQCLKNCEIDLLERRSSIISMVLSAKDEFCSKADLREYFLHPKVVTHPLPSLGEIQKFLFPLHQVEKSIEKKSLCVINDQDEHVILEDLLYYEPFSELNKDVTKVKFRNFPYQEKLSIFCGRKPTKQGI